MDYSSKDIVTTDLLLSNPWPLGPFQEEEIYCTWHQTRNKLGARTHWIGEGKTPTHLGLQEPARIFPSGELIRCTKNQEDDRIWPVLPPLWEDWSRKLQEPEEEAEAKQAPAASDWEHEQRLKMAGPARLLLLSPLLFWPYFGRSNGSDRIKPRLGAALPFLSPRWWNAQRLCLSLRFFFGISSLLDELLANGSFSYGFREEGAWDLAFMEYGFFLWPCLLVLIIRLFFEKKIKFL